MKLSTRCYVVFYLWFYHLHDCVVRSCPVGGQNRRRITDSLHLPFCRVPFNACWETTNPTTASCGLSVSDTEYFPQAIGKRRCGDVFVKGVDAAASGTEAVAPPRSLSEAGEGTPSIACTMHGQELIVGGTAWNGEPLNEPSQGLVFQNILCDGDGDPQCYPSCWCPLWWKYAPHSTFSSDVELLSPEVDKTDDFAMEYSGTSSRYRIVGLS